jgi:excisionase family DNA binding protein
VTNRTLPMTETDRDSGPELLNVQEAAAVLRLKASTIRSWLLERRIPFIKLGGRVFLRRRDLDALIEQSTVYPHKRSETERAA